MPSVNIVVRNFAARASIGTRSLNRHMLACRKKLANDCKVQSKLAMNVHY
jgi:hypothetical protein